MKRISLVSIALTFSVLLFAQSNTVYSSNPAIQGGVGLGAVIAVVASWSRNESILWAILHGILGWLYVIYFALTR